MARLLPVLFLAVSAARGQEPLKPPPLRLPGNVKPTRYAASLQLTPGQDQFNGHIRIEIKVIHPTSVIWLHARALQLGSGRVKFQNSQQPLQFQPSSNDFIALISQQALPPGPAQIEIDYTGEVSRSLTDGAFQQQQGNDWYIFTKFEPITARRVFPCFDEPSFKVPWQLTLNFPKGLKAFSNTLPTSTRDEGGMTQTVFGQTKPLPSYLLAFAVGPFEEVPTQPIGSRKVPGRIIVPRGRASEAAYAASVAPQLIGLLEGYFGRPYPYEKLDQIVVPLTTAWGAMENAGLIAYGDFLLAPPQQDTDLRRRSRAATMEHEMAHQWFGDLVTMAWWDDIWLNEAFASWVESKLLDQWKPEWNIKADAERSTSIFRADSLTTARKIRQPIEAPGDIGNAFDGITYGKGEAVIGMFENYVGATAFQRAVQLYLSKHEWGNATAADLLHAIDQISPRSKAGAGFSTFLNQVGFPLLTVEQQCTSNSAASGAAVRISQARFVPPGTQAAQPQTWQVPVCLSWSNGTKTSHQCELLTKASEVFRLQGEKGCPSWLSADESAAGYYAVSYDDHTLKSLVQHGLNQLSAGERAALLRNTQLLFSSGLGRPEENLAFVSNFSRSFDDGLVRQSAQIVTSARPFVSSDLQSQYAKWIRALYGAKSQELGWTPKPGETQESRLLRMSIVPLVAKDGQNTALRDEADKLARRWLKEKSGLDPDMVGPVLSTAAWGGNREFFDALVTEIKQDKVKRERDWMIEALSEFRSPELARAALDLMLQPGIDVRELAFLPVETSEATRQLAWNFVREHFDQLNASMPSARGVPYGAYLPMAGSGFCDTEHRQVVEQFFQPKINSLPGGARYLANTLEQIRLCTARAEVLRPEVNGFLAKQ